MVSGVNERLKVTVAEYKPNVVCDHQQSIPQTSLINPCQDAINAMPASKTGMLFGRTRNPNVKVPATFPSGKYLTF